MLNLSGSLAKRGRVLQDRTCGFGKKFVVGYQFMKVEREGIEREYRIDWTDVILK